MNHDRFVQMLEAYGSSPAHWPDNERVAAETFAAAQGAEGMAARAALRRAATLDSELDTYTVVVPDEDFLRQIEASAGVPGSVSAGVSPDKRIPARPQRFRIPRLDWRTPRHWLSGGKLIGAGLLSAGVIGLATGLVTTSLLTPASMGVNATPASEEPVYGGTVFSSTSSDWSDQ